jgi:hypothetical protein
MFTKRRRNAARGHKRVRTGHGSADSAGKVLGLATLLCGNPCSHPSFCVLLGQVISYGAAYFGKVYFLFVVLLAASLLPTLFTALLAGRPPVQRLMGSGLERDIAHFDDGRAVRARLCCTCHSPCPWRAPAARFRRGCSSCEPSRGSADAAGRRGDAKPEPRFRTLNRNPKRPRKRRQHALSYAHLRKREPGASLIHRGSGALRSFARLCTPL